MKFFVSRKYPLDICKLTVVEYQQIIYLSYNQYRYLRRKLGEFWVCDESIQDIMVYWPNNTERRLVHCFGKCFWNERI
jgi:hypothetical protein